MKQYKVKPRLSPSELRPIVEFFSSRFPDWTLIQNDVLAREDGPVVQGIAFERLSGGDYRPIGHVHVLVAPAEHWYLEMPQYLNVKVRQISRRQHPEFRDRVVAAMCAEFVPLVTQPLVAENVLELYEVAANPDRSPDAFSLAALNAYQGRCDRAEYWCSRFTELVNKSANPWQECDHRRREYLDQLLEWVHANSAKMQLERVLQEERRKWGLSR